MTKFDKTNCYTSLENLKNVVDGNTGCIPFNPDLSFILNASKSLKTRYETCLAELVRNKENLRRNFIILKSYPACFQHKAEQSNCDEAKVKQFQTAIFVARVWSKYATDYLLATSLRMFYIRSLVPFLDLTEYPLTALSERVPPDLLRAFSTALRLLTRSVILPIDIGLSALFSAAFIAVCVLSVPAMIVHAVR